MEFKRTKIVVTLGPASNSRETIEQLIKAGVNVFRLNFSHASYEEHLNNITKIQEIRRKLNKPVAILQDLSGPKVRIGDIAEGSLLLKSGDEIILDPTLKGPSQGNRIFINYPDFAKDMFVGARLLLADGDIELEITRIESSQVFCKVIVGGELSSKKGVNFHTGSFSLPALTDKDRQDLEFGLKHGVDVVAMSFVRNAADLLQARQLCEQLGRKVPLIAKIEKHEALDNLDEILAASDGLMVARGDLGVEIPIEKVPIVQKEIIKKANLAGKPVITATQMLRSMVDSPRPTRAEVTDVANAIMDGTDAVMLSEETAIGKYPVKAVEMMSRVARYTEANFPFSRNLDEFFRGDTIGLTESVAHSAVMLTCDLKARLVIAATRTGYTATAIAKYRPRAIILALTPEEEVYYRLALVWGVQPALFDLHTDVHKFFVAAERAAVKMQLLEPGDRYVITSGFPLGKPGSINQIKAGTYQPRE